MIWLTRIGVYLGLFAGVGGVFFCGWIARISAGSSVIIAALMVGLFSAVASLGLQGLDVLDLPLRDIGTFAPWKAAADTSLGPVVADRHCGDGRSHRCLAGRLRSHDPCAVSRGDRWASACRWQPAVTPSTAPPQWLTRPWLFLHGIGVAFWVGALTPLAAMARRPSGSLLAVLHRFSRVAVPVVGVLVLTGLVLAIVQVGNFQRTDRDQLRHDPVGQIGACRWCCWFLRR